MSSSSYFTVLANSPLTTTSLCHCRKSKFITLTSPVLYRQEQHLTYSLRNGLAGCDKANVYK